MSFEANVLVPLDLPRQIEHTVGLCRSLQSHLEHGPFERTRRRVRRQLRRTADVLGAVQLRALAGGLDADAEAVARDAVEGLDPLLEQVLWHLLDKAELKSVRAELKRVRRGLVDRLGPVADAG